jgi:hypothetical protein
MQGQSVGFLGSPSSVNIFAGTPTVPNAWATSAALVDRAHHTLSTAQLHDVLVRTCPTIAAGLPQNPGPGTTKNAVGLAGGDFEACLGALSHHLQLLVTYQPPSHYWPLQALETTIFLVAALALIGVTVWRVGPRAARKPALGGSAEQTAAPLAPKATLEIGVTPVRVSDSDVKSTRGPHHRRSPNRLRPRT